MDGLILIDKEVNATSYDAVRLVKRLFNTNKVGHCGTLDPFASGLLIIGINQATKVMTFLEHDFKEYIATVKLGSSTDTLDLTGKVVSSSNINRFSIEELENILNEFKGEITQVPPMYSSIHVDGKKLYEYARNNEVVEIPERKVNIFDIKLLSLSEDSFTIYAHLIQLRRISIGNVDVSKANSFTDLRNGQVNLISVADALSFKKLYISDVKILKRVYNGQDLILKNEIDEMLLIVDDNKSVAIYQKTNECIYHCVRGLYDETYRFKRLKEL